ncbi:uncharacterized protein LOC107492223 [Arachis duranensis]|uniref:Uncharacterized protein LOC107492223 n=1 Tax=Arachis duranensis TaxID=130453 RepID=A0A6P4DNM5_ARADU|nr:uncharacterized protein LOC107492223 [Arachis duranensis]
MRMEGERRKRKLESSEEEKEENEEQKMETFFALVKSTKEARDLLFNKDKTDNKVDEDEEALKKGKATWIPMFQPEDFIDYGELGRRSSHNNNNNNSNNNVPTTTPHASGAGPSEKEKEEVVVLEKQHLQEAAAATLEAPIPEINEQKEKTSDLLDLNLSL